MSNKCEICAKSFRQRCNLNVHRKIHTGITPYKCVSRGKRDLTKRNESHPRLETYSCEICGSITRQRKICSGKDKKHRERKSDTPNISLEVLNNNSKLTGDNMIESDHDYSGKVWWYQRMPTAGRPVIGHQKSQRVQKPYTSRDSDKAFKAKCGLLCHKRSHPVELHDHNVSEDNLFHKPQLMDHQIHEGSSDEAANVEIDSKTLEEETMDALVINTETVKTEPTEDWAIKTAIENTDTANFIKREKGEVGFGESLYNSLIEDQYDNEMSNNVFPDVCPEKKVKKEDGLTVFPVGAKQQNNESVIEHHPCLHSSREKIYICETCSKSFAYKSHLAEHLRIHTGATPYTCNICKKSFRRLGDCRRHEKTHGRVKLYKCKVCQKTVTTNSSLHIHMRIHTGEKFYECQICDKSFTQKGNLRAHQIIHQEERQTFKCDSCSKIFLTKQGVTQHQKTHSEKTP